MPSKYLIPLSISGVLDSFISPVWRRSHIISKMTFARKNNQNIPIITANNQRLIRSKKLPSKNLARSDTVVAGF